MSLVLVIKQRRAEGGANGATAPYMQRVQLRNILFIKMLQLDASLYFRATNTGCMDLMGTCLTRAEGILIYVKSPRERDGALPLLSWA